MEPVALPENPGGDLRTRLAIYATGVRYAAMETLRVVFRDGADAERSLPVEYAGPAPGFFGLDQLNVVLPPELDGAGAGTIRIEADSRSSNAVDCPLE